uniref:Uncharacterized protein n=1 Tax=Ciona savignyi TaxID=51511 RepID=H2Y7G4_CIOSA
MSYGYPPGSGQGYPPQQGAGYPGAQQGYPGAAPGGYPPAGAPGGYPPNAGGYPPAGGAPGGYPPAGGAPGSYPPQGGAPGGYPPQAGAPGGYPPAGGAGYPPQGGYPGAGAPPAAVFQVLKIYLHKDRKHQLKITLNQEECHTVVDRPLKVSMEGIHNRLHHRRVNRATEPHLLLQGNHTVPQHSSRGNHTELHKGMVHNLAAATPLHQCQAPTSYTVSHSNLMATLRHHKGPFEEPS